MNFILETKLKREGVVVDTLAVALSVDEITKLVSTKGLVAANKAIDKFVNRYAGDLKKKLASNINK